MDIFSDKRRNRALNADRAASNRAHTAELHAADDSRTVEQRLEELTLVCAAMWSLLQERTSLTDADLTERVMKLDLADGHGDGRLTPTTHKCPKCARMMSVRHQRCLYCGFEATVKTPFEAV